MVFCSKHWQPDAPPDTAQVLATERLPYSGNDASPSSGGTLLCAERCLSETTMLPSQWRSGSIDRAEIQRLAGHGPTGLG